MAGVAQLDDSIESAFSAGCAHDHGLTVGKPQEPAKAIRPLGAFA
jgi:hypothetical protein